MAVLVTNLLETIRDVGTGIAVPQQPISDVRTMDEIVVGETESRALQTRVLMTFTGVAILLAGLTGLFMAVGYLIGGGSGALIALIIAAGTNLFS